MSGGRRAGNAGAAPLAAFLACLAAFCFCAFASALWHWHQAVTGPCTAILAFCLIACGLWLNRDAGRGDGEGPG